MNYLAHVFLGGDSPELLIGSLLADFLRGVDRSQYREPIQKGIRLHHAVDRFTDSHPLFRTSKTRLRPPYRRYAGVLVDIFYDHFLALHWERYSPGISLDAFSEHSYAVLLDNLPVLPPRLRRVVPYMASEDWLSSYRTREGIDRTLRRLSRRLKRANPLPRAIEELDLHHSSLEADFLQFFPLLLDFANSFERYPTET